MKSLLVILVSLVFLFSASLSSNVVYDKLQLVVEWIPTFCSLPTHRCKITPVPQFTLHGFWPAYSNGVTVPGIICGTNKSDHYIGDVIPQVENDLQKVWPSILQNYADRTFWQDEWDKHGICCLSSMDKYHYFYTVIHWMQNLNMMAILNAGNVFPSTSLAYSKGDIESALQKHIGKTNYIYVSCAPFNSTHRKLKEVFICFDEWGVDYKSCNLDYNLRGCLNFKTKHIILPPS